MLLCCAAFFIGYLSIVRRIKAKMLWKNSVLRWLIRGLKKFFAYRSCTFKVTAGATGIYCGTLDCDRYNGNRRLDVCHVPR